MRVRIATRGSELARWQARQVADHLASVEVESELVVVSTEGDRRLDVPLQAIGGKGVFVKEVQAAVLDGRADVAVHSAKDLPAQTPDGLRLAAALERADVRDALVGARLDDLPAGAVVGTGAPRRRAQLADLRPDLHFAEIRGNVATRLGRLADLDAVVVAMAALDRLGLSPEVVDPLDPDRMVPQVGQGVIAVECRADDAVVAALLDRVDHAPTRVVLTAERAFLERLGGDCDLPAGAHARLSPDRSLTLHGVLAPPSGGLRREVRTGSDARALGRQVADVLLGSGG